jgi:hypothetical protein
MQVIAKQKTYSLDFRGQNYSFIIIIKKNLYSEHNKKYTFLFSEVVDPYFQNTYQTLFNFRSIIKQI